MTQSIGADHMWDSIEADTVTPLSLVGLDAFEQNLLAIIRDLAVTCFNPERQTWIPVYAKAEQLWGVRTGLPLVHHLAQIVVSLVRIKGKRLHFLDNSDPRAQDVATYDEQQLLLMLHHLRRQHVNAACDFMLDLVDARMDEQLMQDALRFGKRHSCAPARAYNHKGAIGPNLRPVSS